MCQLLADARHIAGDRASYWHVGDLVWLYFLLSFHADPCTNIRLWEEDEKLIGYAVIEGDFSIDWQVHPAYTWRGIENEMMAWAESRWRGAMNDPAIPSGRKRNLFAHTMENDAPRQTFLAQHGFVLETHASIHFQRSLAEPISEFVVPQGFVVRAVAGEQQAANRALAQREAFPMLRVTDEGYARLMRMPEYERELDIVAVGLDGTIAAYAMVWLDRANRLGDFGPVGARPAFRRRGLTRAVLLEGLRRMKACGADTAIVSTGESNVAAIPLYESVGFRRAGRELEYVRRTV